MRTLPLPPSVARWYDPFLTMAVILATYLLLADMQISARLLALCIIAATTLSMCLCEWPRARACFTTPATTLRDLTRRVAVKWLGVMAVALLSLFLWWLIPFYHSPYYTPLFDLGPVLLVLLAIALVPYLYYTEWRLGHAEDYAWQFGQLMRGRTHAIDWIVLRDGALSMLVRTVFLPLNACFFIRNLDWLRLQPWHTVLEPPTFQSHALLLAALYAILIAAIIPGYLFSFRLLRTHTRTIDHSWFGWAVTLSCYPPLMQGVFNQWFAYHPTYNAIETFTRPWHLAFEGMLPLLFFVGIVILLMEFIHMWGESILGLRSSNLTHRGVITNGIFRTLRHPIYLSKCIGWFLIFTPFALGQEWTDYVRQTLLFGGVCLIYYLRAIAEERVMARDPDYVAYALWTDRHGTLAWVGRLLPFVTFQWRHTHWHLSSPSPSPSPRERAGVRV